METGDCLNQDLLDLLDFQIGGGLLLLGVEACDGQEFMRVYESLREIEREIGGEDGFGGWWGLDGVFFGVFFG